jgi:hypothetical protein
MKNRYIYLFLLFLFMIQPSYGQQKQGLSAGGQAIPAVSLFVSGDYFSPGFEEVNAVFRTIEKNYLLPSGRDFKDYYNVLVGIRFTPVPQQSVQIEFGGSIFRSRSNGLLGEDRSASSIQMSYVGGTYLLNFPLAVVPVSFFVGGGLGYVWLNAQRSYSIQPGIARVNAGLTQLHGLGGVEYINPTGVTLAIDAGYSFATTLFPRRADVNFTIKGITGGIKIGVPLIRIF